MQRHAADAWLACAREVVPGSALTWMQSDPDLVEAVFSAAKHARDYDVRLDAVSSVVLASCKRGGGGGGGGGGDGPVQAAEKEHLRTLQSDVKECLERLLSTEASIRHSDTPRCPTSLYFR